IDVESGELRRNGAIVRLQPQPLKVLALLAEHSGDVISRQQIEQEIWGDDTHVDFEVGLNYCIKQIRSALDDDAETPQYVQTLPRLGYRFIPAVERHERARSRASSRSMLAVLPFGNLTGQPEQEYFADGMTDELIAQLGRLRPKHLGVIALTSAKQYKDTAK